MQRVFGCDICGYTTSRKLCSLIIITLGWLIVQSRFNTINTTNSEALCCIENYYINTSADVKTILWGKKTEQQDNKYMKNLCVTIIDIGKTCV